MGIGLKSLSFRKTGKNLQKQTHKLLIFKYLTTCGSLRKFSAEKKLEKMLA